MFRQTSMAIALAATTALGGAVFTVDRAAASSTDAAMKTEMHDFSKLSKDGGTAFRDIALARLAIYNAEPKVARDLIEKAHAALGRAKTDNTAFMKAATELRSDMAKSSPDKEAASKPADAKMADAKPADAKTADAKSADAKSSDAKPVAWLPVDGRLTLGEDFVATPAKTAAVKAANEHLSKGDQKGAIETLKLQGVDVSVTTAVLPLESTIDGVQKAGTLMESGKYYEANAALKTIEDGLRFDVVDLVTTPKTAAATGTAAPAKTAPAPAAPASPAPKN